MKNYHDSLLKLRSIIKQIRFDADMAVTNANRTASKSALQKIIKLSNEALYDFDRPKFCDNPANNGNALCES